MRSTRSIKSVVGAVKSLAIVAAAIAAGGGASEGRGHECAAPRPGWIWCDDFDNDRMSSYYEYDNASGNFVRQPHMGINGSTAMHAHYVAHSGADFGYLHLAIGRTPSARLRAADGGTETYRELYWRL
ncbi:MAG TPA: hypothetical protein VFA43_12650, partial [Gemmatimonadaceae bacterium]|nr:hypothetical protein [Gemmatimonadaceae bacterium]